MDKPGKIALFISLIALVAVAVVVVLFFTATDKGKTEEPVQEQTKANTVNTESLSIAYINTDTLLSEYQLANDMMEKLRKRHSDLQKKIQEKQKTFDSDAAYFQQRVKNNELSEQSAQIIYNELLKEQAKIDSLRSVYSNQLANEEFQLNQELLDTVTNFLNRYNKVSRWDYILQYRKGGSIFVAPESMNITNDVLKKLNEEYEK
ncbi:MAG: OmpH family outer membrane protein [Bacteroidales bacterium]|nr:OmpH family outer membrane protein [Bacteroidales bacterium]